MIIFYKRHTGEIIGTIDARVHSEEHLKMWIGDRDETYRMVINWQPIEKGTVTEQVETIEPTGAVDESGNQLFKKVTKTVERKDIVYEPDHPQMALFQEIDRNPSLVYQYKVNPDSQLLELL